MQHDTIFALASGAGRAGVAVVRVSGPRAAYALAAMTLRPLPPPRQASLRRLFDPTLGEPLDDALVLYFPQPASLTGEDVVELHLHGGRAVMAAVTDVLAAIGGLRVARPGEFTRRAFEAGKLDLTEAEALADLIEAETEGQRRQALRQLEGGLARQADAWGETLLEAMALLEAAIDFPDEGLPQDLADRVAPLLRGLQESLSQHLADYRRGERVREGFRIAILGAPNAGKSTLMNRLTQRETAIVSEQPGTTRDVVEARLEIAGFAVWIADTAGLRDTTDPVEAEGVKRALAAAQDADLRILVVDSTAEAPPSSGVPLAPGDLVLLNKMDAASVSFPPTDANTLRISAKTGQGLTQLRAKLEEVVTERLGMTEVAPLTRLRHREAVEEAASCIGQALQALPDGIELASEDLRMASRALGRLRGHIDVERILDQIFAKFCIGK